MKAFLQLQRVAAGQATSARYPRPHSPRWLMLVAAHVVLWSVADARAVPPKVAELVEQANAAYAAGDFDAALQRYGQAEVDCPACPELAYNQALAHYRKGDFDKAREQFNAALATRDLDLEARAKYNLGNVAYSQTLEKLSSLKEAIELARQAIVYYRDTLDLTPNDEDARANIETAQLLIKDLLDKQKKEQEKQEQNQDQQEQDQQDQQRSEDQSGQDKPEDEQEQGEQDQQQKQQDKQDQQEQQQGQGEQQETQPDESQEHEGEARQVKQMTQEEAQRMLQAVRDKEAQRREERAQRRRAQRVRVSKDW